MVQYRCMKCNYRFQPKTDKEPTRCPYCGTEESLRLEESAEDLVRKAG